MLENVSVGSLSYLGLAAGMFLDGANVPFTPIELILGLAGYLLAVKDMTVVNAFVVALGSSLLGNSLSYWLGRTLGRPFLNRYGKYFMLSPELLEKSQRLFKDQGIYAAFLCRFVPGIRNLGSFILGVSHMPYSDFILLTGLAMTIWIVGFFLIGFYFGVAFAADASWIVPLVSGILIGGILFALALWYLLSKKRAKTS